MVIVLSVLLVKDMKQLYLFLFGFARIMLGFHSPEYGSLVSTSFM